MVKKKVLILSSKEIDGLNSAGIYDIYQDLYLSEENDEEDLLQGIHLTTCLKTWTCAKKADSKALTFTIKENTTKKTFGKWFEIPLDFDFFKHLLYHYGLKEDLIVRLELNFSESGFV